MADSRFSRWFSGVAGRFNFGVRVISKTLETSFLTVLQLHGTRPSLSGVIAGSGSAKERQYAVAVLNVLEQEKHWVLVSLLLENTITHETLPLILDQEVKGGLRCFKSADRDPSRHYPPKEYSVPYYRLAASLRLLPSNY
ncbi:hypothetical protein PZA11_000151 [Diplocarpon coronariae]